VKIPPTKAYFGPESIAYILSNFRDILEGKSFLSSFKFCEEFEQQFAAYHGARYGVTCSNGTSALELCLRGLRIENRDIIVPTLTFAATAYAVIASGNRPILAESAADLTLDPADVERCLTPRTTAILTVHIGGRVSPLTRALQDVCRRKGLLLIEDAAHAHGSSLDGQKAGTFGQAAGFSFFSTKVMTTGEGGMVLTGDAQVRDRCLLLRNYAKVNNQNYHEEFGFNWRMTEVQALMGLAQLRELDEFLRRRRELAAIYDACFGAERALQLVPAPAECAQNFYKYLVLLPPTVDRSAFTQRLKKDYEVTLGGPVYEIPLHEQPAFQPYVTRPLPRASDLCRRHICPPMYYTMTDDEAHYVARSIRETLRHFV
jgi:dTDP-4-amino-4,6-dideoxygalactose transaminase